MRGHPCHQARQGPRSRCHLKQIHGFVDGLLLKGGSCHGILIGQSWFNRHWSRYPHRSRIVYLCLFQYRDRTIEQRHAVMPYFTHPVLHATVAANFISTGAECPGVIASNSRSQSRYRYHTHSLILFLEFREMCFLLEEKGGFY